MTTIILAVATNADEASALCEAEFSAVKAAELALTEANEAYLRRYTKKRAAACDEAARRYNDACRAYNAKLDAVWPGRPCRLR